MAPAVVVGVLLAAGAGCGDSAPGTRTTVTLGASGGDRPAAAELEQAGEVLDHRFRTAELAGPRIRVDGDRIVATFAGEVDRAEVEALLAPGELAFRKVLAQASGAGRPGQSPAPETDPGADPELAVAEKIDDRAMAAALDLLVTTEPAEVDDLVEAVRPFGGLSGPEVSVLPTALQFAVPSITCEQLEARPAGAIDDPDQMVVACDPSGEKSLLDAAAVVGADVAGAGAAPVAGTDQWEVTVSFTPDGQHTWTDLTREAVDNQAGTTFEVASLGVNLVVDDETGRWRFEDDQPGRPANRYPYERDSAGEPLPVRCAVTGDSDNCLVAVVLDHEVITAPQIQSVIQGDARIVGAFTTDQAQALAAQISSGALSLVLEIESFE